MQNPAGAPFHFDRGATRKGQQQDAPGIGAATYQMRDAIRQRVGLPRTGTGDDQQRASVGTRLITVVLDGLALFRIEAV
jgi:hypothetical protein